MSYKISLTYEAFQLTGTNILKVSEWPPWMQNKTLNGIIKTSHMRKGNEKSLYVITKDGGKEACIGEYVTYNPDEGLDVYDSSDFRHKFDQVAELYKEPRQ